MQPEIVAVIEAVIAYVVANPNACDNEECIERWWLANERPNPRDVSVAVGWLLREGYLEPVSAGDGAIRYRRRATHELLKTALDEFRAGNKPKE